MLPAEPQGVNRGKEHSLQHKSLKEYTLGGLLKTFCGSKLGNCNCCGKIIQIVPYAREQIIIKSP